MSNLAIRVDGLSKQYEIGTRVKYRTLRDSFSRLLLAPFRHARELVTGQRKRDRDNLFWALQDVSFDVNHGEILGIIGRNGAGKSTLLKILSRITEPTRGWAEIRGRVGSLLEVGTGFHPELTGRENVFLNGAVLGMRKAEIHRHFDEIIAFSEVERFVDTPVKHYSSGMYLRLAFAVAAHLQPQILIVDEVLAVGDASFQKKCLAKMQEVGQEGRTVLFVSHNMQAVTRLCKRTILLDDGRVLKDGPSHQVISTYLDTGLGTTSSREWPDPEKAPGNGIVRLRGVRVRREDGSVSDVVDIRRPVGIEIEFEVLEGGHALAPSFGLINEEGDCIFVSWNRDPAWRRHHCPAGRYVSTGWIPGNLLAEGTIVVGAGVISEDPYKVHVNENPAVAFQVVDSMDGDSARGEFGGPIPGIVRPLLKWSTSKSQHRLS